MTDAFTFRFNGQEGRQAQNVVIADSGANHASVLKFDVQALMNEDEIVASASGSIDPAGPTLGSVTVSSDGYTVNVPLSGTLTVGSRHVVSVELTTNSSPSRVFSRDGVVRVE